MGGDHSNLCAIEPDGCLSLQSSSFGFFGSCMIEDHTEWTACVPILLVVVLAVTRVIAKPVGVETKDLRRWSIGQRCRAVATRLQRTESAKKGTKGFQRWQWCRSSQRHHRHNIRNDYFKWGSRRSRETARVTLVTVVAKPLIPDMSF